MIDDGGVQRSTVNEVTVRFSEEVTVSASDFILQSTGNITPDVAT